MNLPRLLLALLLLLSLGTAEARRPRRAPKAKVDAQAARLYAEGMKLAAAGEHREALARFTESYRLGSHPNALYNIAVCHEQLGDPTAAVSSYEQYLALPDPPDRDSVKQRVDAIRQKPSHLTIRTTPPGANVIIGDRVIAPTPLGLDLPPGVHTLRVELTGHRPASFDVRAEFGLPLEKDVVLDPIPPPPLPPPPPPQPAPVAVHAAAPSRTPYGKIAAWSTVGAGAALIGVGTIFGIQARGAASDAQECEGQVPWPQSCFDAIDRHDRLASRATLLIGIGTGLTIGGAVWTWFLYDAPNNNDASLKAGIDKEEATLVYQTRF